MKRFISWLTSKLSSRKASPDRALNRTGAHLRQTGSHLHRTGGHLEKRSSRPKQAVPRRQPEFVDLDPRVGGRVEDSGPGKNVLIRNIYLREDTGTHETLKILDDSIIDTEEETGIDPYNTGQFDRSRNWDKRTK
jgi:lipoate-protein ligase B